MPTDTHTRPYAHTRTRSHTRTHTHTCTHTQSHTHAHTHTLVHTRWSACAQKTCTCACEQHMLRVHVPTCQQAKVLTSSRSDQLPKIHSNPRGCARAFVFMRMCLCGFVRACVPVCARACVFVCLNVSRCVCVSGCACVCMHNHTGTNPCSHMHTGHLAAPESAHLHADTCTSALAHVHTLHYMPARTRARAPPRTRAGLSADPGSPFAAQPLSPQLSPAPRITSLLLPSTFSSSSLQHLDVARHSPGSLAATNLPSSAKAHHHATPHSEDLALSKVQEPSAPLPSRLPGPHGSGAWVCAHVCMCVCVCVCVRL